MNGESGGIERAISAARSLLRRRLCSCPDDIHVARIAHDAGATVVFRETGGADGRLVRAGNRAFICIDENAQGTARARWTAAHELGHFLLHGGYDALDRIHSGGPKSGRDYQIEREADAFAAELLMCEAMFAPLCRLEQPTIVALLVLAAEFGTSLTSTGKRFAELATAACALVECARVASNAGRVKRATRSATFRGEAKQRRALEEQTCAARIFRGETEPRGPERVTSGAWGSEHLAVEMTEHAIWVAESDSALVWLWHAPLT